MNKSNTAIGYTIPLSSPFQQIHVIERMPGFHFPPHSHCFAHIILVTSGVLEVITNGNTYTVTENHVIMLPAHIPHELSSKNGYCQIGFDVFEANDNNLYHLLKQTFPSGFFLKKIHFSPSRIKAITGSMQNLTKLNMLKLQNTAEYLLLTMIEQASDSQNLSFRERFLNMVTYDEDLSFTLPQMCAHLNISKTHLERLMHNEFECSAMEYYNRLKIMKACFLLQNSEYTIYEISEKLGFYDESHFTRCFKKNMNTTPTNYRKTTLSS